MQIINLDESTHTYTVDGEVIPSVSQLTRFISRDIYTEIPLSILERAAERGTAVHKATEALDVYKRVEADDTTAPYLKAYVQYLKDHHPQWTLIEWSVCHPDKLYCGTIDRVYTDSDGINHIIDIKTTGTIDRAHKAVYQAQLSLYQLAVKELYPDAKLEILQLKKDETYKLIPLEYSEEIAKACIVLNQLLEKKPRRKK